MIFQRQTSNTAKLAEAIRSGNTTFKLALQFYVSTSTIFLYTVI